MVLYMYMGVLYRIVYGFVFVYGFLYRFVETGHALSLLI